MKETLNRIFHAAQQLVFTPHWACTISATDHRFSGAGFYKP